MVRDKFLLTVLSLRSVTSSSGKPYQTPKGHTPAWTSNVLIHPYSVVCGWMLTRVFHSLQVDWQQGDALQPESFEHLFSKVDGVVHTLGTLLENNSYKHAVREGNIPTLIRGLFQNFTGESGNPLQKKATSPGYDAMNRDSGKSRGTNILFDISTNNWSFMKPGSFACLRDVCSFSKKDRRSGLQPSPPFHICVRRRYFPSGHPCEVY